MCAYALLLVLGTGSVVFISGDSSDCSTNPAVETRGVLASMEETDEAPFLQATWKMGKQQANLQVSNAAPVTTKDLAADTLLRNTKFLTTHDSATGYLSPSVLTHILTIFTVDYLKTQDYPLTGQLDCGARALDLRIGKESQGSSVSLHHAGFFIPNTDVSTIVLPELIKWAAENPTELVILLVGHCYLASDSTGCDSSYYEPFTSAGIQVQTDPTKMQPMTLGEARSLAALPGGGMILAIGGEPVNGTFQSWPGQNCGTVTIYGNSLGAPAAAAACLVARKFASSIDCAGEVFCPGKMQPQLTPHGCNDSCWTGAGILDAYAHNAMKSAQDGNRLGMVQAFWQETAAQIASFGGTPCASSDHSGDCYSILDVSWRSAVNRHVASMAQSGALSIGNFIEVNQVNNYGPIIAAALGSATIPPNTCPQALVQEQLCEKDADCPLGSCARPTASTNGLVCCPSGHSDSHDLVDYCTDMPDGTLCYESETCASGWCNGGDDGGRMGHCQVQRATLSPCDVNEECDNKECGAIPTDASSGWPPSTTKVCCGINYDTHSYEGTQYCQGMPDGTLCIEDENCESGWCNGGETEINRMGHCQAKGGTGTLCSTNSACGSKECGAIPVSDASWPPTTKNVCCGINYETHLYDGTQYCQGMPDGTTCIKDENCESGWCNGGETEINRMGRCQAKGGTFMPCSMNSECGSGECGAIPVSDASWPPTTKSVCCGSGLDTHSYDLTQYCQGMPDGTACIKDENCHSSNCLGGSTWNDRMGTCR